ncbi:MAG: molybdopterin-dependent oxidoreductase [Oxalobacteraceae bacterium]
MDKHESDSVAPHSRRRALLLGGLGAMASSALAPFSSIARTTDTELPFENGRRRLVAYPEKRPLIVLTSRPPQLETPFEVFNEGLITPNDAFFVRYHLSGIPTSVDGDRHQINVSGNACGRPFSITMTELRRLFRPSEIIAVNQCSGNSRGHFSPRVTGGQLSNGAMGNARWVGVPLRELLGRAEIKDSARQIVFNGLDTAPFGDGDFVKSLDIHHAMDGEVMLAYQMNGSDLPMLNGYPVKLVVPGNYGTYWIKHVSDIEIVDSTYEGFWMKPAYRIPDNDCACVAPGKTPQSTRPIGRFVVRSFITSLRDGARITAGRTINVRGIAFDGGKGIRDVAYSVDGGRTWREAILGKELSRYSFREFNFGFTPSRGDHDVRVRATTRAGETQPYEATWQPAGYMRNVVESVRVTAA